MLPSPCDYNPQSPSNNLLSHTIDKAEGLSYITEVQRLGLETPGPANYNIKHNLVQTRIPFVRFKYRSYTPTEIKKNQESPNFYSYADSCFSKDRLFNKAGSSIFGLSDQTKNSKKITFAGEFLKQKEYIPAVGYYEPRLNKVYIPCYRKRVN